MTASEHDRGRGAGEGDAASFGGASGTVLDRIPMPPCARTLGFAFVEIDRERRRMTTRFEGAAHHLNPRGGVQGGFLVAMMDDAMGSMIVALTDGRYGPASVDIHAQFLRPAGLETLRCESELVHMTKNSAFTRATLTNAAGEIVAMATQTARLLEISPERGGGAS